uniref:spectrin alpha chain, non-erythrocytic 1-like n=1 Tax=Euleptes europaea TaxID=460621 RepID=UPI00253F681F|nr:spectrin alpha chain, non-erythrocytic 1-like [Euleptes europaea]
MSGGTARKIQPFTISTKLSLPKCSSDFPGDSCPGIPVAALDNRVLHQNLNERVSLYLAQASPEPPEGRFDSASPTEEGATHEDHVNRNSLSRSIKKITLSNWGQHGEPCLGEEGMLRDPAHASCERNFNNNNCRTGEAQFKAEKWVQMKLRDLKDGCSIQKWEQVPQTLQRDMKDFENTIIKLNQMGEQLLVQSSPTAETMRRQLQTLREQWHLLKQMAANHSKATGGLRTLQEFNHTAEQLEAWIRRKEEKPLLAALLHENADKIQLTRRILDLKQEEQRFQVLHEEMNNLAHKLEKQGKSESRNVVARRKHINKMWLHLQGTLKEHHEMLQLALEAAAFLQQADVLLEAIHAKWRSHCGVGKQRKPEPGLDLDVRDIASQVMMLDVTVSQLTSLHPSLIARVSLKHQDVKESWAQLQQLLSDNESYTENDPYVEGAFVLLDQIQ